MSRENAILSASVVGYSRLMRVEPAQTKAALEDVWSDIFQPNLTKFGGRVLDSVEERTTIEFSDTRQALLFGIALQLAMRNRNFEIREDRHIQYRIGIETVPIAAKASEIDSAEQIASSMSELTEVGRLCISGSVRDSLSDRLNLTITPIIEPRLRVVPEYVRPHEVKLDAKAGAALAAAEKPVQPRGRFAAVVAVTAVLAMAVAGLSLYYTFVSNRPVETVSQSIPDRPSIVVMPFENLTTDTEGSMFAHGITASIISALAQVPQLFVISSNSSFSFAEQLRGARQIGTEFGVRYVLVGSVQVSDNNIRVIAELSDSQTGETLWTERFDRNQDDVFAVQDEITLNVLVSLQVALTEGRRAAVRGLGTTNVSAYLGLLKAEAEYRNFTKASMEETRRLLEDVRKLDPNYYHALLLEARTHTHDAQWGYSDDSEASIQAAAEILQEAALLDGEMSATDRAEVQIAQAYLDQVAGDYSSALENALAAVDMSPNNSTVISTAGWVASFDRKYRRSNSLLNAAIALNPIYPSWWANFLSRNYTFLGQNEEAIRWARDGVLRAENDQRRAWALANLVFAYAEAGQPEDAQGAAERALNMWPDITISTLKKAQPFQHEEDWERFAAAMRDNGIPE